MQRFVLHVMMASACLVNLASAQEQGLLTRGYVFTPKAGQSLDFEKALVKHLQWAKENGESWDWSTYQAAVGDKVGSYIIVTHGHTWSDFDQASAFRRKAAEQWSGTVSRFVESQQSSIFELLVSHSRMKGLPETNRLLTMRTFYLRPFADRAFLKQFSQITEAIAQQDGPPSVLAYRSVYGGESRVTFVHPLSKWSDIASIDEAVRLAVEAIGPKAAELADTLRDLTVRSETAVLVSRPDLSLQSSRKKDVVRE